VLNPDSLYWIKVTVHSANESVIEWGTTADISGPGVAGNYPAWPFTDDGFFLIKEPRARGRRLHGRTANLRMGGALSRYGEARRADCRHRENTIHDSLFTETLVDAITSDPGFNRGFYASSADVREGLLRHAKMWAVMGWSTEFF
jgi:hypothetical protein